MTTDLKTENFVFPACALLQGQMIPIFILGGDQG
jgi:hypothetical protein